MVVKKKELKELIDQQAEVIQNLTYRVVGLSSQLESRNALIDKLNERVRDLCVMAYPCPDGYYLNDDCQCDKEPIAES